MKFEIVPIMILVDVDNALLDNDCAISDLEARLTKIFGQESQKRYRKIFDDLKTKLGDADYLGTLKRFRIENNRDAHVLDVSLYLTDYPFANRIQQPQSGV